MFYATAVIPKYINNTTISYQVLILIVATGTYADLVRYYSTILIPVQTTMIPGILFPVWTMLDSNSYILRTPQYLLVPSIY